MSDDLTETTREALESLRTAGHTIDALFSERTVDVAQLPAALAHAFGIIEGAGIALGLTSIELLDELGLLPDA